ncbi:hypothetical protein [Burkholderia sp. Bp8992]|nr:hypothetical protein [Burkholderia sp. Bp8992]
MGLSNYAFRGSQIRASSRRKIGLFAEIAPRFSSRTHRNEALERDVE